ncbi:MAG: hypothetical protein ACU0DK_07140 [Pseudooceanicola sp.]
MSPTLAVAGLVAAVLTPAFITYWIIRVRQVWIETFPEAAARRPPTISRAMADLPLGDTLGWWLTGAAFLMVVAAGLISLLYARTMAVASVPHATLRRRIMWSAIGIALIQLPVSGGIALQSIYSLRESNDLHMAGSYILFIGASLGQIICITLTLGVMAAMRHDPAMREIGLIHAGAARLRFWAAAAALTLAISYLALFVLKDTSWNSAGLYQTYVITEIVLIVALMAYLMFHGVEFLQILMRRDRSPAASRRPAPPAEER